MEQAARVANPVSGRIDAGYDERPVTTLMVLCRYAFAIVLPVWIALAVLQAEVWPWWWALTGYLLVGLPLSAGAHGSWWRPSPCSSWHVGTLAQLPVLLIATAWAILADDPMVMVVAAALLVGATLGIGGLQLLQRRGLARP